MQTKLAKQVSKNYYHMVTKKKSKESENKWQELKQQELHVKNIKKY